MEIDYSDTLKTFDGELAAMHMRGQWLFDPQRRDSAAPAAEFGTRTEPTPAGVPHLWRWQEVYPKLVRSCEALTESYTARRALAFKNPTLPRCTALTLNMAIQAIRPGEIAWAHRHTIAAIRFVIQGSDKLRTVVEGIAYPMENYDLVLTPSWTWHDHRNDADDMTLWLDVLDVPFVGNLHQGFYEELGNKMQPLRNRPDMADASLRPSWDGAAPVGGCRYPWRDTERMLAAHEGAPGSPFDGLIFDYAGRPNGGPTLPTLSCSIQRLPPGFSGRPHRHTSSAVYFVLRGDGSTEAGSETMQWSKHDSFVVPNWTWHRHVNRSATEDAILFTTTDAPALRALGLYREEAEASLTH